MSRLYGRAFDVYQMSNYISETNIPRYIEDKKNISVDDLESTSTILNFYLPDSAIEYIENNNIHILKSPFFPKNMSALHNEKNREASIFFKGVNFKEEHKRELVFFLGAVLSQINADEMPKKDDLPCEYGEIFPLLLEYIYLKENDKEDRFIKKHLYSLKYHGEKYQKIYEDYQRCLVTNKSNQLNFYTQNELVKQEEIIRRQEAEFLGKTLTMLIPYSSVDGVLQIIDNYKSDDEIKDIIEKLFENKNNNRQELLKDYGIESYGFKRLRKEFDKWGNR